MLSQVKKITDPTARKEIAGRFGAWWDGREYVPEETSDCAEGEGGSEVDAPKKATQTSSPALKQSPKLTPEPRLDALEAMWGEGRFGPGSEDLDALVLNLLFETGVIEGNVGLIGADPALIAACGTRDMHDLTVSEWRTGSLKRHDERLKNVQIISGDVDRPRGFADGRLAGLLSIDSFAYADHKAGFISRAHNALQDGGRWVILDMTRTTAKTPAEGFASAWAEAQLVSELEIDDLLQAAGFHEVQKQSVTDLMITLVRKRMASMSEMLETSVAKGVEGRQGARFLQELVWELQSWKARLRALEGGAIKLDVWVMIKGDSVAGSGDADAGGMPVVEPDELTEAVANAPDLETALSELGEELDSAPAEEPAAEPADEEPAAEVPAAEEPAAEGEDESGMDQNAVDSLFD